VPDAQHPAALAALPLRLLPKEVLRETTRLSSNENSEKDGEEIGTPKLRRLRPGR